MNHFYYLFIIIMKLGISLFGQEPSDLPVKWNFRIWKKETCGGLCPPQPPVIPQTKKNKKINGRLSKTACRLIFPFFPSSLFFLRFFNFSPIFLSLFLKFQPLKTTRKCMMSRFFLLLFSAILAESSELCHFLSKLSTLLLVRHTNI